MPIGGIEQPELLSIGADLRLRKYDGRPEVGFSWYQDPETVRLVDGRAEPYSMERLRRMYDYLNSHGELYWIEIREGERWHPVGDVTFWPEDMPIVIGDRSCRGRHLGRRVVAALVARGRSLGFETLEIQEIYEENLASRRCFEAEGFRAVERTEKGWRYRLCRDESAP